MTRLQRYRAHYIASNLEAAYVYVLAACWQQAVAIAKEELRRRTGMTVMLERLECLPQHDRRSLPLPSRRPIVFESDDLSER
ncbi:hypothetical protein [Salinicola halophilus]|uniref:hypothetical protein n=1 Tax=Salinicola halophilus TaxID=184065 RepID=UPI000DA2118F|nr:hypothetical protein [Salinicola halophilus]